MAIRVRNSDELKAALQSARGGERIELVEGDYNALTVKGLNFNPPVTITSANPDSPTTIDGRIWLQNCNGVVFDNIELRLADDEPASWMAQLYTTDSSNITVKDVVVAGRIATSEDGIPYEELSADNYSQNVEGHAFGLGMVFRQSGGITLDNVDVSTVRTGIVIQDVDGFDMTNSRLHDIRVDGLIVTDASNVRVADNLFDNFHPLSVPWDRAVADHADFIQYYGTNGTKGVNGFEITGNAFLQGGGAPLQAIFGRMNTTVNASNSGMKFTDFVIRDNIISTAHPNAIFVSDVEGATITNNTLLPAPQDLSAPTTTMGLPWITVTTDARPLSGGGYDLTRGRLPDDTLVQNNVVVGHRGEDGVRVFYLDGREMAARDIVIGNNALLTIDDKLSNYWGRLYPDLQNGVITDITDLIGASIGGARNLAPWLIEAASKIPTTAPGDVSGNAGNNVLTANGGSSKLIGGAGNDRLTGGAGIDTLYGGVGNDTMTGGARGDGFSLTAPAGRAVETDIITDLNFGQGDYILFGDGFPAYFFDDGLDSSNAMTVIKTRSVAVLADNADIRELLRSDKVTSVETSAGDLELRFNLDGVSGVDYILRLTGYGDMVSGGPGGETGGGETGGGETGGGETGGGETGGGETGGGETGGGSGGGNGGSGATNQIIRGDAGDNILSGAAGNDTLIGYNGDDVLLGGAGNDVFWGLIGDDVLYGGAGADRFDLYGFGNAAIGNDRIADLDFAQGDSIYLRAETSFPRLGVTGTGALRVTDGGRGLVIDSQDGLVELASHGFARFAFATNRATISFDLNGDGVTDFATTLQGDGIDGLRARIETGTGGSSGGPRDISISAPDFAAGETILLEGFPAGFFTAAGLGTPAGHAAGTAVELDSLADLTRLASQSYADARMGPDGLLTISFSLDDKNGDDVSLRITGMGTESAYRVTQGDIGPITHYGSANGGRVIGSTGDNVMIGRSRADLLEGRNGDDWLEGGAGNDTLIGGNGSDTLIGGGGHDRFAIFGNSLTRGVDDTFVDVDLTSSYREGDVIFLRLFERGTFKNGFQNGTSYDVSSLNDLARLHNETGFSISLESGYSAVLTIQQPAGSSAIEIMLDAGAFNTLEGMLIV
ncbi:MAG: right-handed parallel beta-helix repeat-containing protein [Pikeienuella sp.]